MSGNSQDEDGARAVFERSVKALIRAMMCTGCGICDMECASHAITISSGMRMDPERCTACGRCERSCMVVHYYDKLMDGIPEAGSRNH